MIEVRAVGNALYDFYNPTDDKIASTYLGLPADHVRAMLAEGITDDGIDMEDIAHSTTWNGSAPKSKTISI